MDNEEGGMRTDDITKREGLQNITCGGVGEDLISISVYAA